MKYLGVLPTLEAPWHGCVVINGCISSYKYSIVYNKIAIVSKQVLSTCITFRQYRTNNWMLETLFVTNCAHYIVVEESPVGDGS